VQVPASVRFGTPLSTLPTTTVARASGLGQMPSASRPPTTGSCSELLARSTVSAVPGCGFSVKRRSLDITMSPSRCPERTTLSVGSRLNETSTNSPGTSGAPPELPPRFCGSAHPRVITCEVLIVVEVQVTAGVNGSATSQTERFAAALLEAIRSVIRGKPERCSGAVRAGVE
jgi:hypothetical protein